MFIRKLGILHENGLPLGFEVLGYEKDTVLPTLLITDAKGKIIYSDQTDNYRVRLEPDTFLSAVEQYRQSVREVNGRSGK